MAGPVDRVLSEDVPGAPDDVRAHYVDLNNIAVPSAGPVLTHARQFPVVRLDSVVTFDPIPDGTRLTERIRFTAPWPLLSVTVRQAVEAHKEMLSGIRRHFEALG